MRLTAIEKQVTEQNAMLRTIISSLSLSVDKTEDLVLELLNTEEELLSLCKKLANKKKMVNIGQVIFYRSTRVVRKYGAIKF